VNSLDITSTRGVLLSTPHQFYVLGWGGMIKLGKQLPDYVSAFALTPDNLLMAISNDDICKFDSIGNLSRLIRLPEPGMGVSSGKLVMYLYDRSKDQKKSALFILARGGKYAKLFEVTTPIRSVAELNNLILFTSENGLLSYNPQTKEFKSIAALPKGQEIQSVTVDTTTKRVYFSTQEAVYTTLHSKTVMITNKFGGILRVFNGGLIVFNNEKKFLVRIAGIDDLINPPKKVANNIPPKNPSTTQTVRPTPSPAVVQTPPKQTPPAEPSVKQPPVVETPTKQPEPSGSSNTDKTKHFPSNAIRAERFISNATGNLGKGKTYILKKNYSQPLDFLNNFQDGSILKLTGTDPGSAKSWKVVKPSDGSKAVVDNNLYMYFEQAHVWLIQAQ
jgi:hypothetical protein